MKKLLIVLTFLASIGAVAQATDIPSLVTVTGEGVVKVVPDEVLIRARVEHTGKTVQEVKQMNDKVVNEVLEYLKSQGIPSENFQTEYVSLNKDYNYNTKEAFYSANQSLSILLEDLNEYETLISGLLASGLNRIDGIKFRSSKQEELESEARKMAVLNAKEKAEEYASALNQQVGRAQMISEIETGMGPQPMFRAMEMKLSDAETEQTLAPGQMEIVARVTVGFVLQ